MSNQNRTLDKNKEEVANEGIIVRNAIFRNRDFEDAEYVLVLAKTWGAANLFFFQTALCKFKRIKILYLSKGSQIKREMTKYNTVVIQLSRALENEKNVGLLQMCEMKDIKIINYGISTGV